MGRDNFVHIARAYAAVPHRFGIDNNSGPMFTLIEAPGMVGANFPFEPFFSELLLEKDLQFFLRGRVAAAARVSGWALVSAHENMFFKLGHGNTVMDFRADLRGLVFELNHGVLTAAEGGNMVQAVLNVRHGHHWAETINGVPAFGEIPHAMRRRLHDRLCRRLG